MDFAANRDADYAALAALIADLDVGILINNVGSSHSIPVPFTETSHEELTNIITVNNLATLRVTQLVAPGMIARKRGLILTMGSFGGLVPTPLLATYSGSKAFLQAWSTALTGELAPHGVTVELVQSYLVTSNMSKIRRSSVMVPSPRRFVRAALGGVGRSGGSQGWAGWRTPYWAHAGVQWMVERFVGEGSWALLVWNRGMHKGIRARALRGVERRKREGKGD